MHTRNSKSRWCKGKSVCLMCCSSWATTSPTPAHMKYKCQPKIHRSYSGNGQLNKKQHYRRSRRMPLQTAVSSLSPPPPLAPSCFYSISVPYKLASEPSFIISHLRQFCLKLPLAVHAVLISVVSKPGALENFLDSYVCRFYLKHSLTLCSQFAK